MQQIPFLLVRFTALWLLIVLLASCGGGGTAPTPTGVVPEPSATPLAAVATTAPPTAPTDAPTAAASTDAPDLAGTSWQWVEFQDTAEQNNITVDTPANYTLAFNADGSLNLQADCNVGGGSYTQDGSSLSIELGALTRAACPEGSLDQDYLARLPEVATFVKDGDKLVLNLRVDAGNLVFEPLDVAVQPTPRPATGDAAAPDLAGTSWQWVEFQDTAEQNNITVDTPANYTLAFNADGSLNLQADCNVGGGSYTQDGSSLSIELGALTRAACPEGSLDQDYLARLPEVATFVKDGDKLVLNLRVDSGNLVFQPAP